MLEQHAIRFDGQIVVITGAGRGLGAAYSRLIAALGGTIVVHDAGVAQDGDGFDPSVADTLVAEINAAGGTAAACSALLTRGKPCAKTWPAPHSQPLRLARYRATDIRQYQCTVDHDR
jgi:NAD(P)-dependent dehydrogenase (short-subunit alcohol dehydrogenase family)